MNILRLPVVYVWKRYITVKLCMDVLVLMIEQYAQNVMMSMISILELGLTKPLMHLKKCLFNE